MRKAHKEAQLMFKDIGQYLGFEYKHSWCKKLPTDGVWVSQTSLLGRDEYPFAALEVSVTESNKEIKGSLMTLSEVSPTLGILMIHDEDIYRRLTRKGLTHIHANKIISEKISSAKELASKSCQRIEVWTCSELKYRHSLAVRNC